MAGCSKESVDPANVLGRWEGNTPGGYRVVLVLQSGNTARLSKIGSGPAGFSEKRLRWETLGGKVYVRSDRSTLLSMSLSEGELVDGGSSLGLTRSGPLTGFRYPLLTAFLALVASWLLTPLVRRLAFKFGAVDDPNRDNRRVHKVTLPRWGGLAIFGGFLFALFAVLPFAFSGQAMLFPPYLIGILSIGALLVAVGTMDDLKQYSAKFQAAFLLLAGVAVTLFGMHDRSRVLMAGISWPPFAGGTGWVSFGVWAIPITAVYIFVVTKTMDTIDGIDGLASGIAAIAGATLSIIATYEGQPRVALIAAALAGASIGFLRHNYNPAKIIMGTGGAYLLGFVLATLSIVGAMKTAAAVMILVPVFVFGVPLFDAVQVVIRRRLSGVPITQADKRHIHHQLLDRGLSQRQAVWVLYAVALVLCALLLTVVIKYG
jgi:UDP-GlcNAc:undecaprenyl-phosphate GlcNAc-1-phosphate transferase